MTLTFKIPFQWGRLIVVKVVSREISQNNIYEPYVNFRWQKLRASMRKMAQSDWSRSGGRERGRGNGNTSSVPIRDAGFAGGKTF
jgi:hypothetical protein